MADAMQIDQKLQNYINQPLDELVKDNRKLKMQKKKAPADASVPKKKAPAKATVGKKAAAKKKVSVTSNTIKSLRKRGAQNKAQNQQQGQSQKKQNAKPQNNASTNKMKKKRVANKVAQTASARNTKVNQLRGIQSQNPGRKQQQQQRQPRRRNNVANIAAAAVPKRRQNTAVRGRQQINAPIRNIRVVVPNATARPTQLAQRRQNANVGRQNARANVVNQRRGLQAQPAPRNQRAQRNNNNQQQQRGGGARNQRGNQQQQQGGNRGAAGGTGGMTVGRRTLIQVMGGRR